MIILIGIIQGVIMLSIVLIIVCTTFIVIKNLEILLKTNRRKKK